MSWERTDVLFAREWARIETEGMKWLREAFVEAKCDERHWPARRDMMLSKLGELRLLAEPRVSDGTAH